MFGDSGALLDIGITCKKCGVVKTSAEFRREPRNRTGLSGSCMDCANAAQREWARNNPESRSASRAKYDEAHPGAANLSKSAYVQRNAEAVAARTAAWAKENPEKIIQSRKTWAERNPEKVAANTAAQNAKRDALVKERRGPTWGPRTTADGRRCSSCHERKPTSDFSACKSAPDGLHTYCRSCGSAKVSEYFRSLPEKERYHRGRKHSLKKNYGLTMEAYEALLSAQGHACAICRDPIKDCLPGEGLRGRSASVDHDHGTGAIRGILCVKCNAGLGQFRDNENFLGAAISYLNRSRGIE